MKALVIGASGYLGSEILHYAQAADHDAVGTYAAHPTDSLYRLDFERQDKPDLNNYEAVIWAANGYPPGAADYLLRMIVSSSARLIYVSSNAASTETTLATAGSLGDYARMKKAEEEIACQSKSLILRLGPLYGSTASGRIDNRSQLMYHSLEKGERLTYWDNVFNAFTPVSAVARYLVESLENNESGTYFLGPDTRESYFQFYRRRAEDAGLNSGLISTDKLSTDRATALGISFDTSFRTHPRRIKLATDAAIHKSEAESAKVIG